MGVMELYRGANGAMVINASPVGLGPIARSIRADMEGVEDQDGLKQVQLALASWAEGTQGPPAARRWGGIYGRDRYVTPNGPLAQIRLARAALDDDIVGTAAEVTESLALAACGISCRDEDEESVWDQIAGDLELDARLREAWQLLYTDSQFVMAAWWEPKTYTSDVETPSGQRGRKKFDLVVPAYLDFIDTARVTPVGPLTFRQERLAYIAEADEASMLDAILDRRDGKTRIDGRPTGTAVRVATTTEVYGSRMLGASGVNTPGGIDLVDPIIERLMVGRYQPSSYERIRLQRDGVRTDNLFLLDNRYVSRHCLTRPGFNRFGRVRMKSIFPLLDLKAQLRQIDRALLIGGASYIVLVTLGSDKHEAQQPELDHLRANVETIGQIPVIVGDHRLKIEIVSPKVDTVLSKERYDNIDNRILAFCYGTFAATGTDGSGDDPTKLGRVIGKGLESRRRMLRRFIEKEVFEAIRDNNPKMKEKAKLKFLPNTIALSFDSAWASFLLDLREANEISRETILAAVDLDQDEEAMQRQREKKNGLDELFQTRVPHGSPGLPENGQDPNIKQPALTPGKVPGQRAGEPAPVSQRQAARMGRRKGGAAPGSGQGQGTSDPRRSDTGPRRQAQAAVETLQLIDPWFDTDQFGDDPTMDQVTAAVLTMSGPELIDLAGRLPEPIKGRHHARKPALATQINDALLDLNDGLDLVDA